ncbi:MAG: D-Ala-D-Ala carboxypeptidase family metallohydrolase [Prevotella sp.]|nr:D-Ala-D-Ala carboxypeptidase family metallohydrolase [Prevotella sp.]
MEDTKTCTTDIQLSKHFRLSEFTRSATAMRYGIDNETDVESVEALQNLCIHVLEPLRKRFGVIKVTSGYRCPELNNKISGSLSSQHLRGEAADIHVGSLETAKKYFYFILDNLVFDQMLLEMKRGKVHCLHISYTAERENRKMVRSEYRVG